MLRDIVYKYIVVTSLTLVFIVGLVWDDTFAVLNAEGSKALEELESGGTKQPLTQEKDIFKKPSLEYNAYNLRDPFEDYLVLMRKKAESEKKPQPEIVTPESPPPLTVQGIVWGGTIPQAIINEKVVKIGDSIENAEIVDIGKDGVAVMYKGRIYKLSSPASNQMKPELKER